MFQKYIIMCGDIPLYGKTYRKSKAMSAVEKLNMLTPSVPWSFRPVSRLEMK